MLYNVKSGAPEGEFHVDMGRLAPRDYATLIIPITEHESQGTTVFPVGEVDSEDEVFNADPGGGYHLVSGSYIFGGHVPHFHEANRSRFDQRAILMTFTKEAEETSFGNDPRSPFAERIGADGTQLLK